MNIYISRKTRKQRKWFTNFAPTCKNTIRSRPG